MSTIGPLSSTLSTGSTSYERVAQLPAPRRTLLYITIDPFDHRNDDGSLRGHGPNLARVCEAAATWSEKAVVRDLWCADLRPETLDEIEVLALFLSGSYTEWVEVFRQPAWRARLDAFCELIRAASIPTLAVCGSHQLVARAFADWSAVGHMANHGAAAIPIATESDGSFHGRSPRVGEVGTFQFVPTVEDPLFFNLTGDPAAPLIFSQWHCDQVLESAVPQSAVSLLRPGELADARLSPEGEQKASIATKPDEPPTQYTRRHVASEKEICRVQALRYDVPPAGRILYTTQFHPDLAGTDAHGDPDHGIPLIHRFLDLAAQYWSQSAE